VADQRPGVIGHQVTGGTRLEHLRSKHVTAFAVPLWRGAKAPPALRSRPARTGGSPATGSRKPKRQVLCTDDLEHTHL
jgi:hypothetical protein